MMIKWFLLTALSLALLFLLPACQQTQPTPAQTIPAAVSPTQAPPGMPPSLPATPSSTASWKADGTISQGEYTDSKTYGDFQISWLNDNEFIYVGIKAKTSGWVAVGYGAQSMMKNADIIEGFITNEKLTIYDMFSTGDFGPHPADTQQGGTDDILASGGKLENGYTTIEFKRKLDTGDKYDNRLGKGTNKIIWAYAAEPQAFLKHMARGQGEIEIK